MPIHAIADLLIFTVVLGSTVYMAFLGGNSEELSAPGWKIFRYFTVDSNVLMELLKVIK